MYRTLWTREMTASEQAAFQQWASEEHEWCLRMHDARARDKAYEHEVRVQLLRGNSQLFAAKSRGSEEVTVVTGERKAA
jgi:hypothetical protein